MFLDQPRIHYIETSTGTLTLQGSLYPSVDSTYNIGENATRFSYGYFDNLVSASLSLSGQLTSTLATGTAPFVIASSTVVANLNADLWDGYQFSDYLNQAVKTTSVPLFAQARIGSATTPAIYELSIYGANPYIHIVTPTSGVGATDGMFFGVTGIISEIWSEGDLQLYAGGGLSLTLVAATQNANFAARVQATRYISTVAIGTAPLTVTSTTLVSNLNVDYVDGVHIASLTSTRLLRYNSTGTQIESSSIVEASGALSGITTIGMSGQLTNTLATGTAPFVLTSSTGIINLNADMVDSKHVGTSGNKIPLLDGANTWSGVQTHNADIILTTGNKLRFTT